MPGWVSGIVTTTSTAPAACAAVVAVIVVAFTTVTFVAAAPPSATVAPAAKFVPVMVTLVPPAAGPKVGAMADTVGGGPRYLNPFASVPVNVLGLVTTTLTGPLACAPVVPVIVVA